MSVGGALDRLKHPAPSEVAILFPDREAG